MDLGPSVHLFSAMMMMAMASLFDLSVEFSMYPFPHQLHLHLLPKSEFLLLLLPVAHFKKYW
jgi:hypothetical protein